MNRTQEIHDLETNTLRKVKWHVLPFLFFLFVISYIDRSNIGFAALEMNKDLGISAASYGLLSGIFYIGYIPFQIPGNLLLCRIGARLWLSCIVIAWGMIIIFTGAAQSVTQLYIVRISLGAAEAGLLPGCLFYMTRWFPQRLRGRSIALFMTAIPVSSVIGAPLTTSIMDHVRWLGLAGWRWAFILEGLPAIAAGILGFVFLTDRPEHARWLSEEEKNWLMAQLRSENAADAPNTSHTKSRAFLSPRVWRLSLIYFTLAASQVGLVLWLPTIIKGLSSRLTNARVGLIVMIPYVCATAAMLLWSRHSDKTGERKLHAAFGSLAAAFGLVIFGMSDDIVFKVAGMSLALTGIYCFYAPFWSLPSQFLAGEAAAVGIAAINSVGMIGGFLGPSAIGYLTAVTGTVNTAIYFVCGMLVTSFLLTITMDAAAQPTPVPSSVAQ